MTLVSLTSPRGWPQPSLHVALRSEMSQTPSSSETQFLQGADVQPHAGGRESVRLVNSERRGPLWFCRPVGARGRLCPSMSLTDGHQALTSNHGNTAVTMRPTPIKTDGDFRIHSCSRPEGRDWAPPIELPQTALCPSDRRGKLRVSRAVRAARVARGPLTKPKPPSGVCAPAPSHAVCGGRWGVLLTGLSPTAGPGPTLWSCWERNAESFSSRCCPGQPQALRLRFPLAWEREGAARRTLLSWLGRGPPFFPRSGPPPGCANKGSSPLARRSWVPGLLSTEGPEASQHRPGATPLGLARQELTLPPPSPSPFLAAF